MMVYFFFGLLKVRIIELCVPCVKLITVMRTALPNFVHGQAFTPSDASMALAHSARLTAQKDMLTASPRFS